VAFHLSVALADADDKRDKIQICVDHVEKYSAEVFCAYERQRSGLRRNACPAGQI
jgi:hypothetical protein